MNPTTTALGTAVVAVGGRISQDKPITVRIAVGAGVYAVGLSILSNGNAELASRLALLVFITTLYIYGPSIAKKTGLIK